MLVSHRHRFIFVKTKKTGSSTSELWLKRYCPPDDSLMSSRRVGRAAPERNHASAQEIHDLVGAEMWRGYLTIANVRNPWDKMVSLLFYRPARTARFDSGELDITSMDQARRRSTISSTTCSSSRPSSGYRIAGSRSRAKNR